MFRVLYMEYFISPGTGVVYCPLGKVGNDGHISGANLIGLYFIVETIINTFDGQSFENPLGILEYNSMLCKGCEWKIVATL